MKELTPSAFLDRTPALDLQAVEQAIKKNNAEALALFEVQDFGSSHFGHQVVIVVGPTCTYKTIDAVSKGHYGDLPSQRHYPVAWVNAKHLLRTLQN